MNFHLGLTLSDFYTYRGLWKIDRLFLRYLQSNFPEIYAALKKSRTTDMDFLPDQLVSAAIALENFISNVFPPLETVSPRISDSQKKAFFWVKRNFVQRHVAYLPTNFLSFEYSEILKNLPFSAEQKNEQAIMELEQVFAQWIYNRRDDRGLTTAEDPTFFWMRQYAVWAMTTPEGQACHQKGVLFHLPHKMDYKNLISNVIPRQREGFNCTTSSPSQIEALDQAFYCLYCHHQGKDSCAKGFPEKRLNPLGNKLEGCPLRVKVSEMNLLLYQGNLLAALAVILRDNPLAVLTGNRICNDCSKSCIFQNQEPVDVPTIESFLVQHVLELPLGFEIYGLLTRWNPLRTKDFLPQKTQRKKVMVVGLGPAGLSLSYHLLHRGYTVVALEGMPIHTLPNALTAWHKNSLQFEPIVSLKDFFSPLEERENQGFGGVAEYGITARWDKNLLFVSRLLLERYQRFRAYGNMRLGSSVRIKQVFAQGFSHLALCLGAGRPNTLTVQEAVGSGVMQASDFLMRLHLGAYKKEASIPLEIKLPIAVIGGGLTAVDAATEALAYYSVQLKKTLKSRKKNNSVDPVLLEHARILEKEPTEKRAWLKKWGGCTLVYRQAIQKSPAYRLNHHELVKAQEEGVDILDNKSIQKIQRDAHGRVEGILFQDGSFLPAKTILVAIGTHPNTVLAQEESTYLSLSKENKDFFSSAPQNRPNSPLYQVWTGRGDHSPAISAWGDLHPQYSGSVVRALASVKDGFPVLEAHLKKMPDTLHTAKQTFRQLDKLFMCKLLRKKQKKDHVIFEVWAPAQTQNFKLGHFFRLQVGAEKPLAMTAFPGKRQGTLYFYVKTAHPVFSFLDHLKKGDDFPMMGPVGNAFPSLKNKKVLLAGFGFESLLTEAYAEALKVNNQIVSLKARTEEKLLVKLDRFMQGKLPNQPFLAQEVDWGYVLLSKKGRDSFRDAHTEVFSDLPFFTTLFCPMQCMMKGICAQCLQKVRDLKTQQEKIVYACNETLQPLQSVLYS